METGELEVVETSLIEMPSVSLGIPEPRRFVEDDGPEWRELDYLVQVMKPILLSSFFSWLSSDRNPATNIFSVLSTIWLEYLYRRDSLTQGTIVKLWYSDRSFFPFRTLKREKICWSNFGNGKREREKPSILSSQSDPVAKWRNKRRRKTRRGSLHQNNCPDSLQTLCSNRCDSNLCDYQFFIAQF